jgi:hypothetical protein
VIIEFCDPVCGINDAQGDRASEEVMDGIFAGRTRLPCSTWGLEIRMEGTGHHKEKGMAESSCDPPDMLLGHSDSGSRLPATISSSSMHYRNKVNSICKNKVRDTVFQTPAGLLFSQPNCS